MSEKAYWRKRRVLVTGHEGFLGSSLTKKLIFLGANIVGIDIMLNRKKSVLDQQRNKIKAYQGTIANFRLMEKIVNKHKPQTIFHLAAEAVVGTANRNPLKTFESNIKGTWNILEIARSKKYVESIVVASSDKAYGSHKKLPYKESFALQGRHPYDVSKSCTDLLCQAYQHTFKTPVCITRSGNIYGPGDYHFSRIVPDGIRHALKSKQFVIRSNGKFTRDYIFIDDIVDGYLLLARKMKRAKLAGEAFNFSTESPISVIKLHNKIVEAVGKKKMKPKILNQAKDEIEHQFLSASKAKRVLKWKAKVKLDKGLKTTIEWYGEHV